MSNELRTFNTKIPYDLYAKYVHKETAKCPMCGNDDVLVHSSVGSEGTVMKKFSCGCSIEKSSDGSVYKNRHGTIIEYNNGEDYE